MIRRPPRSTLLSLHDALPISGVGTPVKGGLNYREAHLLMELIAESGLLMALDLVEVNPTLDIRDRKSTRLNSSHSQISYAVFCLKKKKKKIKKKTQQK